MASLSLVLCLCVLVSAIPSKVNFCCFSKSKVLVLLHLILASTRKKTHTHTRGQIKISKFSAIDLQMLHEFGGNQKFFYQNKVHNFSFLLFKALRFPVCCFFFFFFILFAHYIILTFQVAVCLNSCYLPIGKRFVYQSPLQFIWFSNQNCWSR